MWVWVCSLIFCVYFDSIYLLRSSVQDKVMLMLSCFCFDMYLIYSTYLVNALCLSHRQAKGVRFANSSECEGLFLSFFSFLWQPVLFFLASLFYLSSLTSSCQHLRRFDNHSIEFSPLPVCVSSFCKSWFFIVLLPTAFFSHCL